MQVNLPKYPDGWVTESLDAAAHINPESLGEATPPMFRFRYIDISSVSHGEIDWATVTDQTFSTSPSRARRIVRPRDVLLCTVRPGLQSHTFANWSDADGYVCSTGFAVIHATDRVEPRYLFHLIFSEAVSAQLRQLETGSNYPAVNESDVRSLRVPIAPLPEQRRIAEILDTIDAAIQQTDTLIAKLKQRKAGLLHDLLTRGLDENGELRDPLAHPEQFKDSPLGRIPREWGLVAVGEVFDMQLGKMLSKAARTGRNPYPYLANRNVLWERVDLSDLEMMDFSEEEQAKFSLLPGDLLVCEGGEVGRTAIWHGEIEHCYFQKAIHRLRPKDSRVSPEYMLRFMRRAVDCGFLTNLVSQTSIAHLTQEKLALLPIALPLLEEQKMIVCIFDAHDSQIRTEEIYREKLKQMKQGLMEDLLTGRVSTDGKRIRFAG